MILCRWLIPARRAAPFVTQAAKAAPWSACFLAELDGQPVAEAWLQTMNLSRIIETHPGLDCRRIDLSIGEKQHWNKGLGTEIIRALVDFGFAEEKADFIFACDIADYMEDLAIDLPACYIVMRPSARRAPRPSRWH